VLPGVAFILGWMALTVLRCLHPKPVTAKAAAVFKKFDTDKDGFMQHQDMDRLSKKTGTQRYDDENWDDWCAMVKADPVKGLSATSFENIFLLKDDGQEELDTIFAALFPTPQSASESEARAKFDAAVAVLGDRCCSLAGIALYILHPTATAWLLAPFACEDVLDDMAVLRADRGVQCYTGPWVSTTLLILVPGLYLFCNLVPAVASLVLRDAVQQEQLHTWTPRLGFLFRGYRPEKALWELIVTGRKLALAWAVVFLDAYGSAVQAVSDPSYALPVTWPRPSSDGLQIS
jgi:hypothetical protein